MKAQRVFDCTPHADDLQRAFGIDITKDLQMSLPNTLCRPCYQSMERAVEAIEAKLVSRSMVKVHDWSKHAANNSKVSIVTPTPAKHFTHMQECTSYRQCHWTQTSRYPAKHIAQTKNLIQHIEQIVPQILISSNEHPAVSANQFASVAEMLLCAICQKTLDQPIQLSCDTLVCPYSPAAQVPRKKAKVAAPVSFVMSGSMSYN